MIKIFIADDHAIVRQGLKQIVSDQPDMTVAGEAENGAEVMRFVRDEKCDLIILDITLPDKSGLDLLPEIKNLRPEIKILILSMHTEEQFAIRALKSGASGYLTKMSAPTELIKAIRRINAGGKYINQAIAEQLAFFYGDESDAPVHERLSDREFQVMRMIGEGRTLREIADTLHISEKTVSTYRTRILEKMNMTRNAELIRYAVQNKLVE